MSMEEDLVRLVRATVKAETENHMRNRSSELIGRGGDTVVGGMGNIYLQPGANKKAFYKGVEIGSGSGSITGSGTTNYLPRFTGATAIGNSHLVDNGSTITSSEDIQMLATKTEYFADIKTGAIFSKKASVETIDYYGLQITPYNTHGTNPGNFYIGDDFAAPAGTGIYITDTAISLVPVSGGQINVYGTVASRETEGTSLYRMKINDSAAPPSVGKGGIYIDTDDNNVYVNKGTYAAPSWQLVGGAAVWGGITGTLSNQTDLQTALDTKLNLSGGTMAGIIAMGSNKITGLAAGTVAGDAIRFEQLITDHGALTGLGDNDHPQYALLAASNTFNGGNQLIDGYGLYIKKPGGSEANYPSVYFRNDTYAAGYYQCIEFTDGGKLHLKSSEGAVTTGGSFVPGGDIVLGSNKLRGTAGGGSDVYFGDDLNLTKAVSTYADMKSVGNITPGVTDSKDLGSSSLFWNEVYAQIFLVDDTATKITNSTGNMVFTVAAGKKFQFVVSA